MRGWIDRGGIGRGGLVLAGLALLAMVQIGAIVARASRATQVPPARPPDLVIGDAVPAIRGLDARAGSTSVALQREDARWTVLLAFSPTCAWCDSVAPRWKSWTAAIDRRVAVVGISSGEPSAALRYAHAHGWKLGALIVVDSAVTGVLGRQLTRKTPWLFLFDSRGVLRYSGHGNEVETVDSLAGISK